MINKVHYKYWRQSERDALRKLANGVPDLNVATDIARGILVRHPYPVYMVSGPISTGGTENMEINFQIFRRTIEILVLERHLTIFSQMPFQDVMVKFFKKWKVENPKETFCGPILEGFYSSLFSSGLIRGLHFIFDWESSIGANWEYDQCEEWQMQRYFLGQDLRDRTLM
jgi:hypothetical protein